MANIKSSKKDIRRSAARADRNAKTKSRIKTLTKKAAKTPADARTLISSLEKATKSNVVHPNKVARIKSRLAKLAQTKA